MWHVFLLGILKLCGMFLGPKRHHKCLRTFQTVVVGTSRDKTDSSTSTGDKWRLQFLLGPGRI